MTLESIKSRSKFTGESIDAFIIKQDMPFVQVSVRLVISPHRHHDPPKPIVSPINTNDNKNAKTVLCSGRTP